MRRRFHERGNVAAELVLATQLLRRTGRIAADRLAHFFLVGDSLAKAATADDLLLQRSKLLQLETGFPAQLPRRSLEYNAKVFPDKPDVAVRQLQRIFEPIA